MIDRQKPMPRSLLIFGASGRIGGSAASHVRQVSPQTRLRLATSSEKKAQRLQAQFPGCEVVVANYLDVTTLIPAFKDMEGVFIITPDFLDERQAMFNVVAAARHASNLVHLVRLTGDPPGVHSEESIPLHLREFDGGTAVQHLRARKLLDGSGLPVTYINIAAYYMADFLKLFGIGIASKHTLFVPYDRLMAFLDSRDVGEVAACLLLSTNQRHLGKTYHLDNGVDLMRFSEVARLMSEVLGVQIDYNDSPEDFMRECAAMPAYQQRQDGLRYALRYYEWECGAETLWRRSDILEALTGHKGRTLRQWLEEHRDRLLGTNSHRTPVTS
jgi:uncharacterized protein YbjT (DUF2867 family)